MLHILLLQGIKIYGCTALHETTAGYGYSLRTLLLPIYLEQISLTLQLLTCMLRVTTDEV